MAGAQWEWDADMAAGEEEMRRLLELLPEMEDAPLDELDIGFGAYADPTGLGLDLGFGSAPSLSTATGSVGVY